MDMKLDLIAMLLAPTALVYAAAMAE